MASGGLVLVPNVLERNKPQEMRKQIRAESTVLKAIAVILIIGFTCWAGALQDSGPAKELVQWVAEARKAGMPEDQIQKNAALAGWQESAVNEALRATSGGSPHNAEDKAKPAGTNGASEPAKNNQTGPPNAGGAQAESTAPGATAPTAEAGAKGLAAGSVPAVGSASSPAATEAGASVTKPAGAAAAAPAAEGGAKSPPGNVPAAGSAPSTPATEAGASVTKPAGAAAAAPAAEGGAKSPPSNVPAAGSAPSPPAAEAGTSITKPTAVDRGVPNDYQISAGDVLHISVWHEPDATIPGVVVRPDGKISMPLLKEVAVLGLTPTQLEKQITQQLSKFLTAPDVTVIVTGINGQKIYFIGAVKKEGPLPYTYRMSVMQALSEAGGLTDYAKRKKIYVLRTENGRQFKLLFDYDAVLKGQRMELNIPLMAGDTIVVPH
jgi:polysaccharide biosynthesis/export protein